MSEQWLSIVEYARNYNMSDMTVRRRIKTGKLQAVLQDGKYFIPLSALEPPASALLAAPAAKPLPPGSTHAAAGQRTHEISVVKGHPSAHKTFYPPEPKAPPLQAPQPRPYTPPLSGHNPSAMAPAGQHDSEGLLPNSLKRPLQASDGAVVETRALLAFCEAALRKIAEGERRTVEKFKSKLEALEAVLSQRDLEIKTLRQQVEDLQLLVKILEKPKST